MRVNVSSIRDFKGLDNKLYELRYIPTLADKAMFIIRDKMTYGNNFVFANNENKTFAYLYNAEQILFFGGENVRTLSAGSSSKRNKKICRRDEANILLSDDGYLLDGHETNVDLYRGCCSDNETGEVKYEFRGLEKLRRDYRVKAEEMRQHIMEGVSVFGTFSSDKKYSADEIKNIGSSAFNKWIKRKYRNADRKDLRYWVICFEPCDDGSWHFHFILSFKNEVPADFSTEFAEWAKKYNEKQCAHQTLVEPLRTKRDVLNVINYLDPTSEKKKDLAVFYPPRFRNIIINGNRKTPKPLLGTGEMFSEVFEKLGLEFVPELSKKYSLVDEDTSEVIYEPCEMWFYVDKARLNECISEALFEAIADDDDTIITGAFMRSANARGVRGATPPPLPCLQGIRRNTHTRNRGYLTQKTAKSNKCVSTFAGGYPTTKANEYISLTEFVS